MAELPLLSRTAEGERGLKNTRKSWKRAGGGKRVPGPDVAADVGARRLGRVDGG